MGFRAPAKHDQFFTHVHSRSEADGAFMHGNGCSRIQDNSKAILSALRSGYARYRRRHDHFGAFHL